MGGILSPLSILSHAYLCHIVQASPFSHKRGGCHSAPWQPLGCGGAELGSKKFCASLSVNGEH